jgi:hypothetical protein
MGGGNRPESQQQSNSKEDAVRNNQYESLKESLDYQMTQLIKKIEESLSNEQKNNTKSTDKKRNSITEKRIEQVLL